MRIHPVRAELFDGGRRTGRIIRHDEANMLSAILRQRLINMADVNKAKIPKN